MRTSAAGVFIIVLSSGHVGCSSAPDDVGRVGVASGGTQELRAICPNVGCYGVQSVGWGDVVPQAPLESADTAALVVKWIVGLEQEGCISPGRFSFSSPSPSYPGTNTAAFAFCPQSRFPGPGSSLSLGVPDLLKALEAGGFPRPVRDCAWCLTPPAGYVTVSWYMTVGGSYLPNGCELNSCLISINPVPPLHI